MALYFLDTSAVVKRYVLEIGTAWVQVLTAPPNGSLPQSAGWSPESLRTIHAKP